MTVEKLKSILDKLPGHMGVWVNVDEEDYPTKPVADAKVVKLSFREDPSGKTMATEKGLVITFD